jgi:glycosyltransferase involved in cell wall biosynthesis
MKVAIVHDFLTQMGGAEKVVEVLHEMFPEAPIYTSIYDAKVMPARYKDWDIRTSFLQRLPMKRYSHRLALMLYPLAFESFDLSEYDLVVSSSSAFAKGVITQPHTIHVCYTHAPMRFAWTTKNYMQNEKANRSTRALLGPGMHYLRNWDIQAASRVDHYIANSSTIAQRIRKFYRRDCDVVYPPVDTSRFSVAPEVGDYYIIVSRFVPYKRLDLAVAAFTKLGLPLKVVGTGRQMQELQEIAGPTVEFMGRVDDATLPGLMARAQAFLMPGEEDFGIAPVEANACGRPVIAFAAGGALDSQIEGVTGVLFKEQTVDCLCEAVRRFEKMTFNPQVIRAHAEKFEVDVFRARLKQAITSAVVQQSSLKKQIPKSSDARSGERRKNDRRQEHQPEFMPVSGDRRRDNRRAGDRRSSALSAKVMHSATVFRNHMELITHEIPSPDGAVEYETSQMNGTGRHH